MDKKQRISWGVSFGSLTLVAGMVSYLGLSNGDKTNPVASGQNPTSSNNSNLQQDPSQNYNYSFGDDNSSQFNQNDGSTNGFDNNNQQNQDSFSNGGPSFDHHGGFDTTTGGT